MQLPLVAVCRRAHQKLPVSLVSIRPGGVVDTASHEGNINHYHYRRPAQTAAADARLRAKFGAPPRTAAGSSNTALPAAAGLIREKDGFSCMHVSNEAPATGEVQGTHVGTGGRDVAVRAQQHARATSSRDASGTAAQPLAGAGSGLAADEVEHAARNHSQPEQQSMRVTSVPDWVSAPGGEPDQALVLVSVERTAGLSVLDSDALLPGPGGRPERILTGFQAHDPCPAEHPHKQPTTSLLCPLPAIVSTMQRDGVTQISIMAMPALSCRALLLLLFHFVRG